MLITPPSVQVAKAEPKTIRFVFAEIMQAMSAIVIKQGQGSVGDAIEAGRVVLVSNPDGTINIEHSSFDVVIYPGSAKPEAKA